MKTLIGAILILLGIIYILGAIFHRMLWFLARSFCHGVMLFVVIVGIYCLISGMRKGN